MDMKNTPRTHDNVPEGDPVPGGGSGAQHRADPHWKWFAGFVGALVLAYGWVLVSLAVSLTLELLRRLTLTQTLMKSPPLRLDSLVPKLTQWPPMRLTFAFGLNHP